MIKYKFKLSKEPFKLLKKNEKMIQKNSRFKWINCYKKMID